MRLKNALPKICLFILFINTIYIIVRITPVDILIAFMISGLSFLALTIIIWKKMRENGTEFPKYRNY